MTDWLYYDWHSGLLELSDEFWVRDRAWFCTFKYGRDGGVYG